MSSAVTCVVVEDEPEAQASLEAWIRDSPSLTLVGTAGDGVTASRQIDLLRPGLVFLDIGLPERDGIEALRRANHRPEVIFTTAYPAHALVAFELGAVDYLLKPFGRDRFAQAVERCLSRRAPTVAEPSALERWSLTATEVPLERLFARKDGAIVPVPVAEILRIEAQAEYVRIHSRRGHFLVRVPLKELARRLDPARFVMLHRSHIVNLDAVVQFRPIDDRRLLAVLEDGSSVVASRAASERLRDLAR